MRLGNRPSKCVKNKAISVPKYNTLRYDDIATKGGKRDMIHQQIYVLGDLTYPGSPLAPNKPDGPGEAAIPQADLKTRPAAVAGRFYPGDAAELQQTVDALLAEAAKEVAAGQAELEVPTTPNLKAMISPHAGYAYSGAIAATGYAWLKAIAERIKRVVLVGPAHYVGFEGIATVGVDAMATPLGNVMVDRTMVDAALELPFVSVHDEAHAPEHGLEVHLPFLQRVLGEFTVAPFIFSRTDGQHVGELLEKLWGGPETLILVSSDLSHFFNYDDARELDQAACEAIEQFDADSLREEQACGRLAIQGLLNIAPSHHLNVKTLDLRNSGDTAGSKDRVVGYGSWVFEESSPT